MYSATAIVEHLSRVHEGAGRGVVYICGGVCHVHARAEYTHCFYIHIPFSALICFDSTLISIASQAGCRVSVITQRLNTGARRLARKRRRGGG